MAANLKVIRPSSPKTPTVEPLRDDVLLDLARSGLDAADARKLGIVNATTEWAKEHTGYPRAGYLIPYPATDYWKIRFTEERKPLKFGGELWTEESPKYCAPKNSGTFAYFPALLDWAAIRADPSIAIVITEGEKKAAAMCKAGFPCVALGGVDSFSCANRGIELLPELEQLCLGGRSITVCYDSDVMTKKEVRGARIRLEAQLLKRGAAVFEAVIEPPKGEGKAGLDDLLVAEGPKAIRTLLAARREITTKIAITELRATVLKGQAELRNDQVSSLVLAHMRRTGQFLRADDALVYFDDRTKVVVDVSDTKRRELRAYVDDACGVNGGCAEWAQTHEKIANWCATHGARVKVYKLAHFDAATRVHYLACSDHQMFRTTASGSTVVDNGTDGVFMRPRGKLAKVVLARRKASKAAFTRISGIPNFSKTAKITPKHAQILWEVWQLAVFFPELLPTRFIVLFHGEKGAGKTIGGRSFGRTLMGPDFEVFDVNGEKLDGMDAGVANYPLCVFDNVDGKQGDRKGQIENRLAIYATRGVMLRRKLYTTLDEQEVRADAFVIATSRDPKSFTRDDVIDRLLYLPVERRIGFVAESEMLATIDGNRAGWWTYVIDRMPKIIDALGKARTGEIVDERMADFAKFALVVGPILGHSREDVKAALASMAAERTSFVAGSSPLIQTVQALIDAWANGLRMRSKSKDKDAADSYGKYLAEISKPRTARELLVEFQRVDAAFPFHNPVALGTALRDLRPALAARFDWCAKVNRKDVTEYVIRPTGGWDGYLKEQQP